MAIIKAGILSKVSGKVAGVVGSTWKGKNYLRELVKPANPNTALQQGQRNKMKNCVACARNFVGDVFKPYLDKFLKDMSGYNYFVKTNIAKFGGANNALTEALAFTFGNLGTGSIDWKLNHDNGYIATDQSVPSVPTGHTLVAIGIVWNDTKKKAIIDSAIDIGAQEPVLSWDGDAGFSAGDKVSLAIFFADVDTNGVVQAISTDLHQFATLT